MWLQGIEKLELIDFLSIRTWLKKERRWRSFLFYYLANLLLRLSGSGASARFQKRGIKTFRQG